MWDKIRYPRLMLLLATFVLAYALFAERNLLALSTLGYPGTFFAGIFYAYGFTAAPATAVLLSLSASQELVPAALLGGAGALLGDLVIFFFIRRVFANELARLERTRVVGFLEKEEKIVFGHFRNYATAAFAGFIVASPLPTEIGVTMLASIKGMSAKKFAIIAYLLHTAGIFVILSIGKLV